MERKYLLVIAIVLISLVFSSCTITINGNGDNNDPKVTVGETKKEDKAIDVSGEKELKADLNMGVGKLEVKGSSDKILDAKFTYNVERWKPEVDYFKTGDKGNLKISNPEKSFNGMDGSNVKNQWDISLNKDIPLSIDLEAGVGDCSLNLSDMNLKQLIIEAGVGNIKVDASGNYKNDVDVKVEGGVGSTTIYVPKNMGVKVKAEKGVGKIDVDGFKTQGSNTFINDSYESSKNKMEVDVEAGVGNITIKQK